VRPSTLDRNGSHLHPGTRKHLKTTHNTRAAPLTTPHPPHAQALARTRRERKVARRSALLDPFTYTTLNPDCQKDDNQIERREEIRTCRRSTCERFPYLAVPTRMLQKGGDPAAGSPTATLLRLRPSHRARLRPLPPEGWLTGFGHSRLPWRDGRCVQGPGTDSPWRS
jgi:hypothetical protein